MKTVLRFLLFVGLVLFATPAIGQNLINTLPIPNANFIATLQTFLSEEDAERYDELAAGVVVTGGIHVAGAGLTKTPSSLIAYADGWRITETGSIIYPPNSTCVVIAGRATTGNVASFTRVPGTHYLIDCTGGARPVLPNDSVWLMEVTTDGTGVTVVEDLRARRTTASLDAGEYESFGAALDAIGSDQYTLLVQNHLYINQNLTVPANVTLWVVRGGQLEVGAGFILTLAQPIVAGRYRIFASGSEIAFGTYAEVYPEWWGAFPGDSNDDAPAIQVALMALPWSAVFGGTTPVCGVVSLAAGNYRLDTTIEINQGILTGGAFEGEKALVGQGERATVLSYYGAGRAISIHALVPNDNITGFRLANFALNNEGTGTTGIYLEQVSWVHISHLNINGFYNAAPGVITLESSTTQVVDFAAQGYGIHAYYLFAAQIEHTRFDGNNVGFYCQQHCNGDILGPSNNFYSGNGTENFSVVLRGSLSQFEIKNNLFEAGNADSEGEILIWDGYDISLNNNRFENCEATRYVYANNLGSFRNHGVTIDENYFSQSGTTKRGVYMRSTTGGSVSRNVFTGPSLGVTTPGPDIELGPGASRIVMEGNEAFLTAALGAVPLPQAGDSRSVTVKDANSAALAVGTRGAAYGQVGNTGLYVPGAIASARGGIQEARTNLATQSSFDDGVASVTYVGAVGGSVGIQTTGWHSNEAVYGEFPLASTTDADRIEFNNTSVTCAIGDYFTVSFAAANNVGTAAGLDDLTFQMEDSEDLGSFTPQLDNFWSRYSFVTGQCQGVGAVELRAFQNTAQTGALRVLVDAVQVERNVSAPGAFIATGAAAVTFEGMALAHGGLQLASRIETVPGNTTFDQDDGTAFLLTNSNGGTNRNFNPTGTFPAGHIVALTNSPSSIGLFTFDSAVLASQLMPGQGAIYAYDGAAWRKVSVPTPASVTLASLGTYAPENGAILYCSNCGLGTSPCAAGAGTGAFAFRVNGAWQCPAMP